MAGTLSPWVGAQFFDNNGDPAAGWQLFTYAAGTATKQATYQDADLSSANTNPIILDAAGRCTVFLDSLAYKFVFTNDEDTDPPTSPVWTIDNVNAVPPLDTTLDVTGTAGETLAVGDVIYLSDGGGSRTAGYWYLGDANNDYSSSAVPAFGFAISTAAPSGSVIVRLMGRVTGLSSLIAGTQYYMSSSPGALTSTPPANARQVGVADTATSLVIWPGQPFATESIAGLVSTAAQTFGGQKTFAGGAIFEDDPVVSVGGVSSRVPYIVHAGYSGGSTTVGTLSLAAAVGALGGLADDGDQLICEWDASYSSATLSARIIVNSTNTDFGAGSNTTECTARVAVTRISSTSVNIQGAAWQGSYVTTTQGTQAVSDLDTNAITIDLGMASGTYTLRGYRITLVRGV